MKCVVCKSADIQQKHVEEEIRQGGDIVLVPIEVLVCNNCGERYYNQAVMHRLEELKKRVRDRDVPLEDVGRVLRANIA